MSRGANEDRVVLKAEALLSPFDRIERAAVVVDGGWIEWVGRQADLTERNSTRVIELDGCTLVPGFVDIHIHGGENRLCQESKDALFRVAQGLARQGTTSFLPTIGGIADFDYLEGQVEMVHGAQGEETGGAEVLGIHLEGPFLSSDKAARGSQSVEAMRSPSLKEFDRLADAAGGSLRYMTIAPELPDAPAVIERMRERGIVPSAGHSVATYEEVERAIESGLRSVTHTYNGMPPMHHRNPGLVGAALTRPELNCELIGDGQHVGEVAMRVLYRAKGAAGITLVTDNTRWAGLPDGRYTHGTGGTVIKEGERCWVEGGTLAGSVMPMNFIVRTVAETTGCGLTEAVAMASFNPAKLIGAEAQKGSLEPGQDADIAALDHNLDVRLTMVGGKVVHQN